MRTKLSLILLASSIFLTGCERDRIKAICDSNPQLCANLHTDGWCRFERSNLIRARYQQYTEPSDASHYVLMTALVTYRTCLEPLMDIEYTDRQERKNDKVEAVVLVRDELAQLEQQSRHSDYPYLQLWHWQRHGDRQARTRFMAQAERPEMQQPELQKALAALLVVRDKPAAEQALHRALGLYGKGQDIDSAIIADLINLYVGERRFEDAWVWTRVMSGFASGKGLNPARMDAYARFSPEQQQQMQQQADNIVRRLKNGTYIRQ
ncbi:DUF2989 domain-containing protein [Zobellella sp. CGMCC 1.18722]|uniref:DUF2989 domain-containing protein n=1 Tax=Zobellella iuensis TaxID=2803811 RepID=A0ABS1QVI0_9GAMM|nr:DUF2989 domain-containing protein [Zobellella iuensis]